jgi:hypothetical protein
MLWPSVAWGILPGAVYAQTAVLAMSQFGASSEFIPFASNRGIAVVPPTIYSVGQPESMQYFKPSSGQLIIPRYGNSQTPPAGVLAGWGPCSVIAGNSSTASTGTLVITEDAALTINKWQRGSLATQAVSQPTVKDLTIAGYDVNSDNYGTTGVVGDQVWTVEGDGGTTPVADSYDLCVLKGTGTIVDNLLLYYAPGDAIRLAGGGGTLNGQFTPFDREKFQIRKLTVRRAFTGLTVDVIDGVIGGVEMEALRDWGIKLLQGSVQFDGSVHIYGVGSNGDDYVAIGNAHPNDNPGACLWVASSAGGSWGGPFYVETARMGMKLDGAGNSFGPVYSREIAYRHLEIVGANNRLNDVHLDIMDGITESYGGVAVLIAGEHTTINGLHCRGSNGGVAAVPSGERVIHITTSSTNGGRRLKLTGVNIIGTDSSAEALLYCQDTLIDSEIEMKVKDGGVAADFYVGSVDRIGSGNTIVIRTESMTASPAVTLKPANGVDGWAPETDGSLDATDKLETNEVWIDGVRWYREGAT